MQDKTALRTLFWSLAAVYVVMMCFTGLWPWIANPYDSYAYQAQAWLQGRLDLGINYTQLDLAVFQGKYFVSLPPFPAMLMLPLVFLFGTQHNPDNLISLVAAFAAAWFAFKIVRQLGRSNQEAVFWSLFATVGGSFLFISSCAWSSFMAQTLSFALCLAAIHFALTDKLRDGFISLGLFAFALGCRPLQVLFLPLIIWLLWRKLLPGAKQKAFGLLWLLAPLFMCAGYALLNYFRFGSILEFGGNWLPEYSNATFGQFNIAYLGQNLLQLIRLPGIRDGKVQFPAFNGFAFFLASPIFLSYFILMIYRFWHKESLRVVPQIIFPGLLLAHLLLLACYKNLGGWQFGTRFPVDAIPFVLLGILWLRSDHVATLKLKPIHQVLCVLGLTLNLAGGMAVFNHWI